MRSAIGLTSVRGAAAAFACPPPTPRAWSAASTKRACEICQSHRYSSYTAATDRGAPRPLKSRFQQRTAPVRPLSTTSPKHQQAQDGTPSPDQASSQKKSLPQILADAIKASGPLTVATYMRTALLDPAHGYYTSSHSSSSPSDGSPETQHDNEGAGRHVLGAKGDFITSPEISQVFGELLAICFVARWQTISESLAPDTQVRLVELGPGKGTLLSDILRTFTTFRDVSRRVKKIHLVETSEGLRRMQEEAIRKVIEGKAGMKVRVLSAEDDAATQAAENEVIVQWFEDVHSVPIEPNTFTMLVAHEFFDALPIHVFQKVQDGFREVLVDIQNRQPEEGKQRGTVILKGKEISAARNAPAAGGSEASSQPSFQFVLSPTATPWSMLLAARNPRFSAMQTGQRVEVSPESWAVARRVGELIAGRDAKLPETPSGEAFGDANVESLLASDRQRRAQARKTPSVGGVGVIVDYGDDHFFTQSFRAFKQHQIVDPLAEPGSADLTANVDFAHLKHALATADVKVLGPMLQAHFLPALGLQQRVEALLRNAPNEQRREEIGKAAMRLVDMTGMGKEYKMLGVVVEPSEGLEDGAEQKEAQPGQPLYPFELQQ